MECVVTFKNESDLLFPMSENWFRTARQGKLGNCWMIAGLAALACNKQGKTQLKRLIKQMGPNLFEVRFLGHEKVCIDGTVPADENGNFRYASAVLDDEKYVWWVPLIEKAYAKLKNGYHQLDGGSGDEIFLLLGLYSFCFRSFEELIKGKGDPVRYLQNLHKQGFPMVLARRGSMNRDSFHAWCVVSVEKRMTLWNPHGREEKCDPEGNIRLFPSFALDEFTKTFTTCKRFMFANLLRKIARWSKEL